MTKRVYRYFFDFLDGQTQWLNQMAAQGWRLVKCGQLYYDFEECNPGEYEYSVEFVADKAHSKSKDYKAFLEGMGYRAFYKNLNVGLALGAVKWRPWAEGTGQLVTAPGGYFKELLIVEKKSDGRHFELHTDLTDKLSAYKGMRNACLWMVGGMLLLTVMCLTFAAVSVINGLAMGAVFSLLGVLPALLGYLYLKPLRQVSAKIKVWQEQAQTHEYQPESKTKSAAVIIAVLVLATVLTVGFVWAAFDGGGTFNSGSVLMLSADSGSTHWNASYHKLNGFRQRSVSLDGGAYVFTVEIITGSGEVSFSIKGKDGTVYYSGSSIPTSAFTVKVDAKDKVILRVDARNHSGSYKISWQEQQ